MQASLKLRQHTATNARNICNCLTFSGGCILMPIRIFNMLTPNPRKQSNKGWVLPQCSPSQEDLDISRAPTGKSVTGNYTIPPVGKRPLSATTLE
jgi:hypothetical protein